MILKDAFWFTTDAFWFERNGSMNESRRQTTDTRHPPSVRPYPFNQLVLLCQTLYRRPYFTHDPLSGLCHMRECNRNRLYDWWKWSIQPTVSNSERASSIVLYTFGNVRLNSERLKLWKQRLLQPWQHPTTMATSNNYDSLRLLVRNFHLELTLDGLIGKGLIDSELLPGRHLINLC